MLFELMRRTAGGNEMNFIEIETPVRGASYREMTIMNGIK